MVSAEALGDWLSDLANQLIGFRAFQSGQTDRAFANANAIEDRREATAAAERKATSCSPERPP